MVADKYLEWTDDPAKKKNMLLDIFADVIFNIPSVMVSRGHRGEFQVLDGGVDISSPARSLACPPLDIDSNEIC